MAEEDQSPVGKYLPNILALLGGGAAAAHAIVPPVIGKYSSTVPVGKIAPSIRRQFIDQGHTVDPERGVGLNVWRWQHPDQPGNQALSGGVFYGLEKGDPAAQELYNHVRPRSEYDDVPNWGGTQKLSGQTWVRNPLIVRGSWGSINEGGINSLFPDTAGHVNLMAKEAAHNATIGLPKKMHQFLDQYAPGENVIPPKELYYHYDVNNRLPFWLREQAIAHEGRKQGYDSIINYGRNRWDVGEPKVSEMFDLRENKYPGPDQYFMRPEYQQYKPLLDKLKE